uniref:Ig-like domain-containing protein n=1 Tax=Mola mola TaxID=94237 RepID=A0A3Q3WXN2_MOLML
CVNWMFFFLCMLKQVPLDEVFSNTNIPYLRVRVTGRADLECCQTNGHQSFRPIWVVRRQSNQDHIVVRSTDKTKDKPHGATCSNLSIKSVQLNDSGLYRCYVGPEKNPQFINGAYLQVYEPMEKTINLCEKTKNKILTAEGILLLLCVLLPATALLCQVRLTLENKRMAKEEENIYQGLNLDDCCTTYDQIERSQSHGPYQDVCSALKEEEEIQLEKP